MSNRLQIESYRIASHRIASHRIASHRVEKKLKELGKKFFGAYLSRTIQLKDSSVRGAGRLSIRKTCLGMRLRMMIVYESHEICLDICKSKRVIDKQRE
ncbi:hypothetical protein WN55_04155 [Dufourea novaeangliae]|uniref:Uncharacterized protein n=1 Tax=Dufourea novaeangliae TaxID=178035 RepID=A0A154PLP9_DUFNO|nr:hypothetical protein WN55_04155 [Dufourea novaeangliae]